jgi:hypothetical protein
MGKNRVSTEDFAFPAGKTIFKIFNKSTLTIGEKQPVSMTRLFYASPNFLVGYVVEKKE